MTIYIRNHINNSFNLYNEKSQKNNTFLSFACKCIYNNELNIQKARTLYILLELLDNHNDLYFERLFIRYLQPYKLGKKYIHTRTKCHFDTFNNSMDFLDKIDHCNSIGFYIEIHTLFQSIKDDIVKTKNTCKKKKNISSTTKRLVWNTHIGESIGKSKCLCCNTTDITQMSFHCGHIIAEAKGGETIVSNLKPICQNCNSSMGIKNMDDFMKALT